jgi:hypothetical protein
MYEGTTTPADVIPGIGIDCVAVPVSIGKIPHWVGKMFVKSELFEETAVKYEFDVI